MKISIEALHMKIEKIGIFCGSSVGAQAAYTEASRQLGALLAKKNIEIIYGGGKVGLMGVIADSCMNHQGKVTGVITHFLHDKEVGHDEITHMHHVDNMSERKNLIAELSDAYIALPGGFGTLDEVMEVITYFQLGISNKPIAFLNTQGYYTKLFDFLEHAMHEKFMKPQHLKNLILQENPEDLLQAVLHFEAQEIEEKWIANLKEKNTY